jgi:3-oxoacyl-[acyl-carrier protein] reductase
MSERNVAVVTGGSTGIGAEICTFLLAQGYEVVSVSRRKASPQDRLTSVEVDLLDPVATAEAAAEIARRFPVTHFIHNAGLIRPALLGDIGPEDIPQMAQMHLNAPVILVQSLLPGMRKAHFGRIVFVASRAALGAVTRTGYGGTKAAMISMARTWALELARDGITVNVVAPSFTEGTEMFEAVVPVGGEKHKALEAGVPVGRLARPDDTARAVVFFADRANSYVTGQVLYVCGGSSLGVLQI